MGGGVRLSRCFIGKIDIKVKGQNNEIVIKKGNANLRISVYGDNCKVFVDENFATGSQGFDITIGCDNSIHEKASNSKVSIGKNIWVEQGSYFTDAKNTVFIMGDACMLSKNITFYNTDGHLILDKKNGRITNKPNVMKIGKHVWIGANSVILKNTDIPDDSIIGYGSVVSRSYGNHNNETGIIIAGNPAKIVKSGITWNIDASKGYENPD